MDVQGVFVGKKHGCALYIPSALYICRPPVFVKRNMALIPYILTFDNFGVFLAVVQRPKRREPPGKRRV